MRIILTLLFSLCAFEAQAVQRFWVGGSGTWDASSTTHWSTSSGGASGASAPVTGDRANIDANSGGGTVTVATDLNLDSIFITGTTSVDWSANNNNVTLTNNGFQVNCSGACTVSLGNGNWSAVQWIITSTNLTLNSNSSTIFFPGSCSVCTVLGTGFTYHTIEIGPNRAAQFINIGGNNTINTLQLNGPVRVGFDFTTTLTINNIISNTGPVAAMELRSTVAHGPPNHGTISSANALKVAWATIADLNFTGAGSFTANNSFPGGNTSGITFNAPTSISSPCILGGWLLWRDLTPEQHNNLPAFLDEAT